MAKKLKSNEDLVLDLINFSKFGAMGQVFVMEAIQSYAKSVVDKGKPVDEPGAMFSAELWYDIASDVKARCDAFYGRHGVVA